MKTKKRCSRCKKLKDKSEFYSNKSHKDKLHHWCKECHKERVKRDYKNNPGYLKEYNKKCREKNKEKHTDEYYKNLSGTKICPKCKKEKSITEFSKNRGRPDGLYFWCKDCWKEYRENRSKKIKET